jgi:hypothetical protein
VQLLVLGKRVLYPVGCERRSQGCQGSDR